jgi:hypothetical protein
MTLIEIPGAGHMFLAPSAADSHRNLDMITNAVAAWLDTVPGMPGSGNGPPGHA